MDGNRAVALACALLLSGCAGLGPSKECRRLYDEFAFRMSFMSDQDVAWVGTALSQVGYEGECACPHHTDSNGGNCGMRSAYSRSGGAFPACTPADIPASMLPSIRHQAAVAALPFECGGMNYDGFVRFTD